MKKTNIGLIAGGTVALAAAGTFSYLKRKKNDTDVTGSNLQEKEREDKQLSPDANKDDVEKGLSALDHAYREEWVANTITPTEEEIKRAEKKVNE
ncbi:LPXTG cell wall anchor domain-containing protein [Terribacillus saccharophilus]|uniref:LPXTG cell wall anchor domain-containing protein n=1 Tax=Terribacillus saccharophilus TaxID=361277 RepID=UPI00398233D6